MAEEERELSKSIIGKVVISKSGKKFGKVGDIIFETRSGELVHILLDEPTSMAEKMDLERDPNGNILIPFSAVIAIGDFVVISEEDII